MDDLRIIQPDEITEIRDIGQGAFGIVTQGYHVDLGQVAIKKVVAYRSKPKQLRKLKEEAKQLSQLAHPNIVCLHGFIEKDEECGIVLEFCKFGSLHDVLETYDCSINMKIQFLYDVVKGMVHLHNQTPPVIHRDLKAVNISIGEDLHAKLADFGMSEWKTIVRSLSNDTPSGTVTHIPPEKWEDINYTMNPKCDVYSFGILIWEVIMESSPFKDVNEMQIQLAVKEGQRPSLQGCPDDTPALLKDLVERCWSQNPDDRTTFSEIQQQLEDEFINNEGFIQASKKDKLELIQQIHCSSDFKMAQNQPLALLAEVITPAFDNGHDCDLVFKVDEKTIGAHRMILRNNSRVLYQMTEGWTPEKDPIVIEDMSYDAFKSLLRYMYNGLLDISNSNVFIFLAASTFYEIQNMKKLCENHLSQKVAINNVCMCLEEALNFESTVLQKKCLAKISRKADEVLITDSFLDMSQSTMSTFLDVWKTNVIEIDIFDNIRVWMKKKCEEQGIPFNGTNMRKVMGEALYKIRFPTMTVQDFANGVTTYEGLLTESEIAQVFQKIAVFDNKVIECPFPSEYRGAVSQYSSSAEFMEEVLEGAILYDQVSGYFTDASSLLEHMKKLKGKKEIGKSLVFLRLTLQYYADLENSTDNPIQTDYDNKLIRQELWDKFENWEKVTKTKNFHKKMTKFTELRMKLNELCKWHSQELQEEYPIKLVLEPVSSQ